MTLNEGPIPRIVTAGDGTWTELAITDAKFSPSEASPPRWRREGNTIRLAGHVARVGEAALAAWFAVMPVAARPHAEIAEARNQDTAYPVIYAKAGEAVLTCHPLYLEGEEGKMSLQDDAAPGTNVSLDGITWTTD